MAGSVPQHALLQLDEREALELAATMPVGRLAHVHEDRLYVTPVTFMLDERDVLLRTADGTEVLAAAGRHAAAALEVDDLVDWSRTGWSVLIRGDLSEVTAPELVRRIESGPGGTTVVHL